MPPKKPQTKLAPADELKREIQAAFDPSEVKPAQRSGFGRYDGLAYIGAEAYFHISGGADSGLRSMQLRYRGKSHWWLVDQDGRVIDMVLGPREKSEFPYQRGRRRPFRYTPAGMSRAAAVLVERVSAARAAAA